MKDIKSYIIGFLTCACLFLIMGQLLPPEELKKEREFLAEKELWQEWKTNNYLGDIVVSSIQIIDQNGIDKGYFTHVNPAGIIIKSLNATTNIDPSGYRIENRYENNIIKLEVSHEDGGGMQLSDKYGNPVFVK